MDNKEKNAIYDRLLEIKFEIEPQLLPDPTYINERIGKCHVLIEEVEKFSIKTSKEISVIQRAFNNSMAAYDTKRYEMLAHNPDIVALPNIKDREAKVNSVLRKELEEIKGHQNELSDLNNLLKAISLKMKNLNRANMDVSRQIRIMESQIRLGTPGVSDPAAKSLMEEMRKSSIGEDSFKEVKTEIEENRVMDPTEPVDIDNLLKPEQTGSDNLLKQEPEIPEKLIDPAPPIQSDSDSVETPSEFEFRMQGAPEWGTEDISADAVKEAEKSITTDIGIDLDSVIELKSEPEPKKETTQPKGGDSTQIVEEKQETETHEKQKKIQDSKKDPNGIDIEFLLEQYK